VGKALEIRRDLSSQASGGERGARRTGEWRRGCMRSPTRSAGRSRRGCPASHGAGRRRLAYRRSPPRPGQHHPGLPAGIQPRTILSNASGSTCGSAPSRCASCTPWRPLVTEPDRLITLCAYPWIKQVCSWTRWYMAAGWGGTGSRKARRTPLGCRPPLSLAFSRRARYLTARVQGCPANDFRRAGGVQEWLFRRSSVVEHRTVNPLVVGSNPTAGASPKENVSGFRVLRDMA
jgi:hypothetical protein